MPSLATNKQNQTLSHSPEFWLEGIKVFIAGWGDHTALFVSE